MSFVLDNSAKTNWKSIGIVTILGVLVAVGALMLLPQKEIPSQVQIAKPETLPVDSTADWQTYRNEEFGFTLEYPSNWTVNENGGISFGDQSLDVAIIIWNDGSKEYAKEQWQSVPCALGEGGGCAPLNNKEVKTIEINDNIVYWKIDGYDQVHAFIPNEQKNKTIEIYSVKLKDQALFDQILSTFRFIESDEKASWKTFRSEKFGFEIKYPPTWKAELTIEEDSNMKVEFDTSINTSQDSILYEDSITVVEGEIVGNTLEKVKEEFNTSSDEFVEAVDDFELDGEKAFRVRFKGPFGNVEQIISVYNGRMYIISTGGILFESDMISTFRFIE